LRSLAEQEDLVQPQSPGENRPVDNFVFDQLEPLLRDHDNAERIAREICALSDRLRANAAQEIGGAQIVAHLTGATRSIQGLDPALISATQSRQIRAQLTALLDYMDTLPVPDHANALGTAGKRVGMLSRLLGRDRS
jgi:hypothetical protein